MGTSKEPVKLRQRKTSKGLISLHLDTYQNGERTYEYLKLYLIPEKTRDDRRINAETLKLAEAIRGVVELRNGEYGFKGQRAEDVSFYEYYKMMCKERFKSDAQGNWGNWNSCLKHLMRYDEKLKKRTWGDIDRDYIQGFRDYLDTKAVAWVEEGRRQSDERRLSQNSKVSYFNKLRACCNKAYDDRVIAYNPAKGVEGFKPKEARRMYLTLEELKTLAATPCYFPSVKKAFLFSCLTGLRRSDIERLKWGDVYKQDDFTRIIFRQKKTNGLEYIDIAPEAAALMGERGKPEEPVFEYIHTPSTTNSCLREWCLRAGIIKHITFHSGRHTFATMMLNLGTDIYTVSKLLGHREISTTQIYAKVIDKNKQAAVARIPQILHNAGEDPGRE